MAKRTTGTAADSAPQGTREQSTARLVAGTAPFVGVSEEETAAMLGCLAARERSFDAGEIIYRMGDTVRSIGIVLEGSVRLERSDAWGDTSLLGIASAGDVFAESYACAPDVPLLVNVVAAEPSRVVFLDIARVVHMCPAACGHHAKLVSNLLALSARKNIQLSQRVFHTSPKNIRGKVLSYLSSEAAKAGSRRFTIPFNRQQLADYLGVDRSALSSELGRMQRDGILKTRRSAFELLQPDDGAF